MMMKLGDIKEMAGLHLNNSLGDTQKIQRFKFPTWIHWSNLFPRSLKVKGCRRPIRNQQRQPRNQIKLEKAMEEKDFCI